MSSKDAEILDAALCRVLRMAYLGASHADDLEREAGQQACNERIVCGAENVLRKWLFGTVEQYEQACTREGYGIQDKEKH